MSPGTAADGARFEYASDQTLLVSFGDAITLEAHQRVRTLLLSLQNTPVAATLNLHPAYCSLLIKFDPRRAAHEDVEREVRARLASLGAEPAAPARRAKSASRTIRSCAISTARSTT